MMNEQTIVDHVYNCQHAAGKVDAANKGLDDRLRELNRRVCSMMRNKVLTITSGRYKGKFAKTEGPVHTMYSVEPSRGRLDWEPIWETACTYTVRGKVRLGYVRARINHKFRTIELTLDV